VLRFLEYTGRDSRDLLDDGVDMMITGDPRVLDYAAGRDELESTPFTWQRSYVLLSTSRANEFGAGKTPPQITGELSAGLARDAVKTDARTSEPGWWENIGGCGGTTPGSAPQFAGLERRVLYDERDPVARGLAERIVALSAVDPAASLDAKSIDVSIVIGPGRPLTAKGAKPRELSQSLWSGNDFAYIVSVPRIPPDPCYGVRRLLARAPWISVPGADISDVLLPLIDTRLHAITKKAMFGMIVDKYGNLTIIDSSMPRIATP